ncbi:MAG: metal-dependent hydrolase [Dysgonomonas sp.]
MDILTHALSGTAVATCISAYADKGFANRMKIILTGTTGGALPDIDAVSMWTRFDATFGNLFGLEQSGRVIYGSKLWYSHHAFFHSLLAGLLIGGLILLSVVLVRKYSKNASSLKIPVACFVAFLSGYYLHLLEDMPTPASVWGGVALFFPSKEYVGGWGKIWWWNNYDIFLIVVAAIFVNLIALSLSKYLKGKTKYITTIVIAFAFVSATIQINTRKYDYSYTESAKNYLKMEADSKKEQQRILGNRVYGWMLKFDNSLKFYF